MNFWESTTWTSAATISSRSGACNAARSSSGIFRFSMFPVTGLPP